MTTPMKELSLFSGAGGGLLGTHLLGWRPIGYVEWDDYCQQVIAARIKDGILPEAPIFGDLRVFIGEGYARAYQGMVDVITAGFPCQPFSAAGKRRGENDERNMWPSTVECIRVVRPRYCLLENVPGLLSSQYFGTILGDLAESGYDARWRVLSAAEMGAPHRRDRLWIVATDTHQERGQRSTKIGEFGVGYAELDPAKWRGVVESTNVRSDDGLAHRVDRLKALGNGQVPAVVAAVWRLLTE